MQPVTITTADVPASYCAGSIQETWPFLVSLLLGTTPSSAYNFGSTLPAPDDQDKPWLRINTDGTPDRWYVFSGGYWLAKHPTAPGTVIIYEGSLASIDTFDGGEVGVVTATTGPMWERATAFDARFPIGVGTLPSTTSVDIGGTGGEEDHTLLRAELPNITLDVNSHKRLDLDQGGSTAGADAFTPITSFAANNTQSTESLNGDVDQEAQNNMPPYLGVFFLRKTARSNYRI